ncbi:MAG: PEP-CTERM sorting domain-containing protein [Planctomyces sp.]|nr:PEP-CTERM sorting domain-containing protein [Planctomyces sp.]
MTSLHRFLKGISMKFKALWIAGLVLAATAGHVQAGFSSPNYSADVVFQDRLDSTTMTLAFDGTHYWSTSGGSSFGTREAQYNSGGSLVATFAPGLDFRSVFTDSSGDVFARQYNNSTIYKQTSPGVFSAHVVLAGAIDDQSSVVLNGNGTEYIALDSGTVNRWNTSGTALSSISLIGWGSVAGETNYPANRGIAAVGDSWLTYSDGTLSMWDSLGNRTGQTTLIGAGTTFDSHFSLSYANGRVFIVDEAGGNWRGYDVGLSSSPVPEPGSIALWGLGALGAMFARRKREWMKLAA